MLTFEQYLIDNLQELTIDFSMRASLGEDGHPSFYIHPDKKDGTTVDYVVLGNQLVPRYTSAPYVSRV